MDKKELDKLANDQLGRMIKWGNRTHLLRLPTALRTEENVEYLATGKLDGKDGVLAATNDRLVFVSGSFTGQSVQDAPYRNITSIETEQGWGKIALRVVVADNEMVIEKIHPPKNLQDIANKVRAYTPATAAPAAAPQASNSDIPTQLKQLAELKDSGILSEDEYESKKAELLSRM